MATAFKVVPKEYRDSVYLMRLSALLAKLPGVEEASAVMATENNLALLSEAGLEVSATGASAADLLVVVRGEASALPAAIDEAVRNLTRQASTGSGHAQTAVTPRSIQMALAEAGASKWR
jgi:hypothetical protein